MKVVFISNSIYDGAGIAAFRIFQSVVKKGVEGVFVSNDESESPTLKKFFTQKKSGLVKFIQNKFYFKKFRLPALKVKEGYDYFTVLKLDHKTTFQDLGFKPDIIHLHWINNIVDYESFFNSIPSNIPIVWTLHDMSAFTGGCIYSWDCRKFENTCDHCPQLPSPSYFDLALYGQRLKNVLYKNKKIYLVADSKWLECEARKSLVFKNAQSISTIHYSIDSEIFKPLNKDFCKEALGFKKDIVLIGFGATYLNSRRKGLKELLLALEIVFIKHKNIGCVVYGSNFNTPEGFIIPPVKSMGKIQSEHLLKVIHSSADMFIIPSLQEAFGQTCLEAMCCGTPVIGFEVGGIPDMVIPEKTGLLAEVGNSKDLAEKINWFIENPDQRRNMGMAARDFAVQNFSIEGQGEKYMEIYRRALINAF